jgi:hypothetical protein
MKIRRNASGFLLLFALAGCEFDHPVSPTAPTSIKGSGGNTGGTTATVSARTVVYPDTIIGATRLQSFDIIIDTLWSDDDLRIDTKTDQVENAFDVTHTCDIDDRWETDTPKRCVVTVAAFHPAPNTPPGTVITRKVIVSRYEDDELWNSGEITISGRAIAASPFSFAAAPLEFGGVASGDSKTLSIRVTADQGDTAVVLELVQSGERFSISDNGCLAGMSRGQSCEIVLLYEPEGLGVADRAELRLFYPGGPINTVFLTGVSLGDQDITFGELPDLFIHSRPVTLMATSNAGLPVVFTSRTPITCTVSGVLLSMVSAGTCTIAADQPGNGVYAAAETVLQDFEINKHSQSIDFDPPEDRPLSEDLFDLEVTADSGLPVTLRSETPQVCTVVGKTVNLGSIGTCRIIATQAGNATFEEETEVIAFQVTKPGEPEPDPDMDPDPAPDQDPESGDTRVKKTTKKKKKGM